MSLLSRRLGCPLKAWRVGVAAASFIALAAACASDERPDARRVAEVDALGERLAVFTLVTEFSDSVISLELHEYVAPGDMRMDAASPSDRSALQELARLSGARVLDPGEAEQLINCSGSGADCSTTDGSRAGFAILSSAVGDSEATANVLTWMLIGYPSGTGRAVLFQRVDQLQFSRTGSQWRLEASRQLSAS